MRMVNFPFIETADPLLRIWRFGCRLAVSIGRLGRVEPF